MKKLFLLSFTILLLFNELYSSNGIYRTPEVTISPGIDTHIHLYDTRREGSAVFLDPGIHEKIYFPHFGDTFADTANPAGVQYAVVVEASKRREDNYWLKSLVDTSDNLLAFIANLDPRDPYYELDMDSLGQSGKFRGIRIRPKTHLDISDPAIIASFAELARRSLVLELGGGGVDPSVVAGIAARYPNMNIIMNHLAGGRMEGDQVKPDNWESRLAIFASQPNVYCKVSMLYALSGRNPAPVNEEFYRPLIDPVIDAFGPDRVMFGSNWTLSDMLGSYEDMIKMLDQYCEYRNDLSPEKFYFENASKAYNIDKKEVNYPGNGNGLFTSYWEGKLGGRGWFVDSICGFSGTIVDDYYEEGSPGCNLGDSFWNSRWQGYLEPVFTGTHSFYLTVNDMARLWIDDQLIIDSWTSNSTNKSYKVNVDLISGLKIPIQIDYANLTGDGYIKLEWESMDLPREAVPFVQLYLPEITSGQSNPHSGSRFIVSPNPAYDYVNFSGMNPGLNHIMVSDATGRLVLERNCTGQSFNMDINDLREGLYFVEVSNHSSRKFNKFIVF